MNDKKQHTHRLAILTSGGDAPCMNACIRAALRASVATGVRLYGVRHGFVGPLAADCVQP